MSKVPTREKVPMSRRRNWLLEKCGRTGRNRGIKADSWVLELSKGGVGRGQVSQKWK